MSGRKFARFMCKLALVLLVSPLFVQMVMPVFISKLVRAQDSTWFDRSSLALDTLRDNVPATELPYRTSNNRDCVTRKEVIRPKRVLVGWPYQQSEQTKDSCSVEASYGWVDEQSYLQRANTKVAGPVKDSAGTVAAVLAVPRTSKMLLLDKSAPSNTVYLYAYADVNASVRTLVGSDGSVTHQLVTSPDASLRNSSGRLVGVQTDSLAFSTDGEWAVAEIPSIGLSRINLQTMSYTPFALLPLASPYYNTAVSGTGRYVAVSSWGYRIFRLYDTNTCTQTILDAYEQCEYVDLWQHMNQKVSNFAGVSRLVFMSDGDLDFYGTRKPAGTATNAHYSLRLPGQITGYGYLGLGDSFSSGEGAYAYRDGTDVPSNRCHASLVSYPYLVGAAAGIGQYNSVACSGARIKDYISYNEQNYNKYDSQSKGKSNQAYDDEIYANVQPGYRIQGEFISRKKPNVITLTAGGNDIGFGDIVARCAGADTCYQYREQREELLNLVDAQFDRLVDLYTNLQMAGGKDRMRLYVLGYPQIVDPQGNCAVNVHLNQGELYFANEIVDYLDSVIKQAAAKAGAFYVDTEHALDGFRLCETTSNNVAVNGLTVGKGVPSSTGPLGPIAIESYHPTAFGQALLAQKVVSSTDNLTIGMPHADASLSMGKDHSQLSMITNASPVPGHSENVLQNSTYLPYAEGASVFAQGQSVQLRNLGQPQSLSPNATFRIEVHSVPLNLGIFMSDNLGNLEASITIPSTVPIGIHTLHIIGKNVAGEDVDIFKTIYVTDGQTPACSTIGLSGEDQDTDGVDDACDGLIRPAPSVAAPLPVEPSPSPLLPVEPPTFSTPPANSATSNEPVQEDPSTGLNQPTSAHKPDTAGGVQNNGQPLELAWSEGISNMAGASVTPSDSSTAKDNDRMHEVPSSLFGNLYNKSLLQKFDIIVRRPTGKVLLPLIVLVVIGVFLYLLKHSRVRKK